METRKMNAYALSFVILQMEINEPMNKRIEQIKSIVVNQPDTRLREIGEKIINRERDII